MQNLLKLRSLPSLFIRNCSTKESSHMFPKQIFSAIQPTGEVHLGNYLGAVKKWVELQDSEKNLIFCIADLHSLSLPQDPKTLHENIFIVAATLLACGIEPNKTIFFKQSDVPQHTELYWIFGTLATMARLSHLPQLKEKTKSMKEIPVGIFMYPILQAADIALYKTTQVPVGQDQIQHILLANDLISAFNRRFGLTFPKTKPIIDEDTGSIKNLLDPKKKMSKSALPKTRINLTDSPDKILLKCKKALTDFNSRVSYDPEDRPAVSNLLLIHSHMTNKSISTICEESKDMDTGKYKLLLAEVIVETLKPIREEIRRYLASPEYLEKILHSGALKAGERAEITMKEVKSKVGIKMEDYILLKMKNQAS